MKKQVLTIDQMKHLVELGVDISDASMYYICDSMYGTSELSFNDVGSIGLTDDCVPTYTLQDILDRLPAAICVDDKIYRCILDKFSIMICYAQVTCSLNDLRVCDCMQYDGTVLHYEFINNNAERLIDVVYRMLCWCAQHNYVVTPINYTDKVK